MLTQHEAEKAKVIAAVAAASPKNIIRRDKISRFCGGFAWDVVLVLRTQLCIHTIRRNNQNVRCYYNFNGVLCHEEIVI